MSVIETALGEAVQDHKSPDSNVGRMFKRSGGTLLVIPHSDYNKTCFFL